MPPSPAMLAVSPLLVEIEAKTAIRLPEYAGSLLRGGFGKQLRELVCLTGAPACQGCEHLRRCLYARLFESPVDPDSAAVLRRYPFAPHPLTLTPPIDGRRELAPGRTAAFHLTLIGPARGALGVLIHVLERMGAENPAGRFRIRRVLGAGGVLLYSAPGGIVGEPPLWNPAAPARPARRLRLQFLTPLRLRSAGRYNARPSFADIAQALFRRLHLLRSLYGDRPPDNTWTHPLLAQADAARVEASRFEIFRWDRFSGRQRRQVRMDGVVGSLEVTGDLAELSAWLRFAEPLHVGSGTVMGMGRFRVIAS